MKGQAMKSKSARLSIRGAIIAAAALIFATGCANSDQVSGPREAARTPTPTPAEAMSGLWMGAVDSWEPADQCRSGARATFTASSGQVTGRLEVTGDPCVFRNVLFEGTLEKSGYYSQWHLKGRISGDPFTDGSAQGNFTIDSVDGDWIRLDIRDGRITVGVLWLKRSP